MYVSVDETHQILIFDSSGTLKTTIGTGERAFGSKDEGDLASPAGIAVDQAGNVYVAETGNHRIQAFTRSGDLLFSQGESGRDEGEFREPRGIALSSEGEIFVADSGNNRIQVFDTTGKFLRAWGSQGDDNAEFEYPTGVAVSADGLVYVTDRNNDRIQVFTADGEFQTDWLIMVDERMATSPRGAIAIDPRGFVYVAARVGSSERVIITDTSGNYFDSWTRPVLLVGGLAISPDSRALYLTDSIFGRIDFLDINDFKIP